MNYRFPGSQRKAWCTAFDRDLRNKNAWSSGEMCLISNIVRRRDVSEEGGVFFFLLKGQVYDFPWLHIYVLLM